VTSGYCFPSEQAGTNSALKDQLEIDCADTAYFKEVKDMFIDEAFLFVQADTQGAQGADTPGWYPLRMQLRLMYWQREVWSRQTGQYEFP
jgi:hypothetical protein